MAQQYLLMGSKVDAVAARLEAAIRNMQVIKGIANITIGLDNAMKTMNMEKIALIMTK